MNIAASGVGKSQSRKRLIVEPLEYMMHDEELKILDFEVCNFTRVGKFSIVMDINHFIPIMEQVYNTDHTSVYLCHNNSYNFL